MILNIVDSIMGSGKTSAMINMINASGDDRRFLYITPYLAETQRIIESCKNKKFSEPREYGAKLNGLKTLLKAGANIASTHALFERFDEETVALIADKGYTLIMDEVFEVIKPLGITRADSETILQLHASPNLDTGILEWHDSSYSGVFNDYMTMCKLGSIGCYGNGQLIGIYPVSVFEAFKEVYVMTYMFEAQVQKYYYDYYGITYNYIGVRNTPDGYRLCQDRDDTLKMNYGELIHICHHEKLNRIGDKPTALSKGWYMRNSGQNQMTQLKNNTQNYVRNICGSKSSLTLWTCFKDYRSEISGNGYAKGYVPSNLRATNEYMDRNCVAYLVNKYWNPFVKSYFTSKGIVVDEDAYALSEMLQFIWRSAIRDGKPINLYVPSSRMRHLLEKWIEENSIA